MSAADNDSAITDFTEANATTKSFNLIEKSTCQTGNSGTKNLEIHLVNCETAFSLNCSAL